jgi:hypothetical protein
MNENYIKDDPFTHKPHGIQVESLNLFIMMGGLLEGTIDVSVPGQFRKKKSWDNNETPQEVRFCKFILSNMSGTNRGDTLHFNRGQKAVIKVEHYMQLLDRITDLKISGSGLSGLTVNVLRKYPATTNNDILIENLDLNNPKVDIRHDQIEHDTFYLELVANNDNVVVESLYLMFKTKKLAGDGRLSINGDQVYVGGDRSNTLPIYTANEFYKLFNLYVKRDLNTVAEAEAYLNNPSTPDGAIVLLPKEAL